MGNQSTKEARPEQQPAHAGRLSQVPSHDPASSSRGPDPADRTRNRQSRFGRNELSLLGIGTSGSSNNREDAPYERRETRQEREARRLERERLAREKERERSLKEEHVDGGYLVTLGTYTGPEDFNKQIVRQLQIDRKIAPFWRGLNDKEDNWTEYQLVCAGRGLPIPAADEQPPDDFMPKPQTPNASSQNLANLTVPLGPRTMSAGSNGSASASNVSSALASPTTATSKRSASPFRPRAKALAAALSGGSRNSSTADIAPREINLPHDPYVNSQPLEVALYKDASECPICFLYYPPYLNHTRCCDQAICSECFVQIKRPEPHFPEHHGEENGANDNPEETRDPEMLVSEPSQCPYCQQADFGVTYEPPPFRRGLAHAMPPLSSMSTAMSSQTSLNSTLSPGSPPTGRRRTQSLSANAPNVITTDRVRPDWSTKLAAQRAHQARRAAAATALHTAAFLIGNDDRSRGGFGFSRPGRFSRRNTGQNSAGTNSPSAVASADSPTGPDPGPRGSSGVLGRRSRMEELEDMMFMEAVRLSLAAEEERARKQEKVERKEAKKRLKEERKAAKKADKQSGFYGGTGSASGSSLSLGLGRRRGNSAASNLRMETTVSSAQTPSLARASGRTSPTGPPSTVDATDKGKGVERPTAETEPTESNTPASSSSVPSLPIPTTGRGPSHLRQMSNASSISSSLADSAHGSFTGREHLDGSGSSLPRGNDADREDSEPLYNFRSLAEMVGVDLENGERVRTPEEMKRGEEAKQRAEEDKPQAEHAEEASPREPIQDSVATLKSPVIHEVPEEHLVVNQRDGTPVSDVSTPELRITPETPAALDDAECESKRLGAHSVVEQSPAIHH